MDFLGFLKEHKIDVIIVIALFLVAFGIRAIPSDRYDDIFGFDSYWGARHTKYLITGEQSFPYDDPNTNYPYGRENISATELGWWQPSAWIYQATALFTGTEGFDYDLFGSVFSWLVAIAGALASPFLYLLGKEIFNNRPAALLGGLFIAVEGNHIFYSFFAHAENDALGLTLMVLTLFLIVKGINTKSYKYLLLSSLSYVWLSMTWISYKALLILICGTVVGYYLLETFFRKIKQLEKEKHQLKKWSVYALLSLLPAAIITPLISQLGIDHTLIPFIGFSLLAIFIIEFIDKKPRLALPKSKEEFLKADIGLQAGIIAVILLISGFALYGAGMFSTVSEFGVYSSAQAQKDRPDYEERMLETIAEQGTISQYIAQQQGLNQETGQPNLSPEDITITMRLDYLSQKYGFDIFIWMAALGAVFAGIKSIIKPFIKKELNIYDVMIAGFLGYGILFLTERLQTFFFLSLIITLGAAYFFNEIFNLLSHFKNKLGKWSEYGKVIVLLLGIAIFMSSMMLAVSETENMRNDISQGWKQVFPFLNSPEVPNEAVIAAWWDYGHWMNYYNGDKINVNLDNSQDRPDIIYTIAKSFTHTSGNQCVVGIQERDCPVGQDALENAEIEALSYLKPLQSTHILVDSEIIGGVSGGKSNALQKIAGNEPGTGKYLGCFQTLPSCRKTETDGVYCAISQDNGIEFSAQDWQNALASDWPGQSFNFSGKGARLFVKEFPSGKPEIYLSGAQCYNYVPDGNAPILYTLKSRLFFKDPSLKHVELVFDNGEIVIYEIDWSDIPDPEELGLENVLPPVNEG